MDGSLNDLSLLKLRFRNTHGYELNLAHPQSFMEKIQWLKLYGRVERFAKYVDKYEVRDFVRQKLGEEYLIPLIGIYSSTDEIPFMSLPNSFVMKATHGSGWNILVEDKSIVDWAAVQLQMSDWLNMNYYDIGGEPNYRPLRGRVLIEEYMADASGNFLDYRFFCFHGIPRCIKVNGLQGGEAKHDIYDLDWTKRSVRYGSTASFHPPVERPENLYEMLGVATQLAQPFPFVRVDLHYLYGKIYFGELTFTPANGFMRLYPVDFDLELGKWLDLTRVELN